MTHSRQGGVADLDCNVLHTILDNKRVLRDFGDGLQVWARGVLSFPGFGGTRWKSDWGGDLIAD